ncbi:UDP-glucuronosyltransferase 2A3-like [Oratosquilla oratoria]|uniref:UDP-glucuronosyltransferase 2A3-like n=1 Tax=Oratosquilla oratoria TaxID=337810 RepID=UPI003F75DD0A
MWVPPWFRFLCVACVFGLVESGKVLVLHPMYAVSHVLTLRSLSMELVKRGHQVTVVRWLDIHELQLETHPNITEHILAINNSDGSLSFLTQEERARAFPPLTEFWNVGLSPSIARLPMEGLTSLLAFCKTLFAQEDLLQEIREAGFDVALVDLATNECSLAITDAYGIPSIGYWAFSFAGGEADYTTVFNPPSAVPTLISGNTDNMNFFQRLKNLGFVTLSTAILRVAFYAMTPYIRAFNPESPSVPQLLSNLSGILINTNYALDYPRPLPPTYINIGGMHLREPKPLPQDLEEFMQSSGEDGVVLFAMGSLFNSKYIPKPIIRNIANALGRLKQKVLMKMDSDLLEMPPNIKLVSWLPQQDILGHPKIKLFITHCGMHGVIEALYHAVPMVGMPIFLDQDDVLTKMLDKGVAVGISKTSSEQAIYKAIMEVLQNPRYQQNAKKISQLLRDQPDKPVERAIWLIEYVMRTKGADHLKVSSKNLNFIEFFCIDLIAFLVLVPVFFILVLKKTIGFLRYNYSKIQDKKIKQT